MPTYEYKCAASGQKFSRFARITEHSRTVTCACGASAEQQISAVAGYVMRAESQAYYCPVTGKLIEGRRKHLDNLARTGCRLLEPGEKEAVVENRKKSEEAFERALDNTVDEVLASYSAAKQEKLASEIMAGTTVNVERV